MKRTPLLFIAMLPAIAVADQGMNSQKVDQQALRDDLQVTSILGSEVRSSDGRDVGTVEDVIFGRDGSIKSVVVQRESDVESGVGGAMEDAGNATERGLESAERAAERGMEKAESGWDAATTEGDQQDVEYAGAELGEDDAAAEDASFADAENEQRGMDVSMDPDRADTAKMGDDFAELDWSSVSFDKDSEVLTMTGDQASLQSVEYDQTGDMQMQGEVRASKLVGLEVNLSDEDSFGEVEDVLIDSKDGKASAIVVDSMEFFDKERYALPVNLDAINTEDEELTLQYTQQQLEEMGEFDMDAPQEENF